MSLLLYLNESELATITTTIIHKIFETNSNKILNSPLPKKFNFYFSRDFY